MKRLIIFAAILAFSSSAAAQQPKIQRGKIAKLDLDNAIVTLKAGDKDLEAIATKETQFFESKDKDVTTSLQKFKVGAEVQFALREKDGKNYLIGLRLFEQAKQPAFPMVDTSKLIPIDELGDNEYKSGFKGGFYPDGKNVRPKEHEAAGLLLAKQIQPLNTDGKADPQGKIVMLSVGMSNTSQASQGIAKVLASAEKVNPRFQFINGAQGGMTAARIQDPFNADGLKYWMTVDDMLLRAKSSREQVQVIWIKQADGGPKSGFPAYAKTLESELEKIVQIFPKRFPNVKMVYLSSRTYGGYATSGLNPEPYAYEGAFSVKWLIERQIKGEPALNFDPKKGDVKAPWLSWGPYLWANGTKKRADGFHYEEADFTANDRTHLMPSAQEKIGRLMLSFLRTDSTTKSWFVEK
jgi:Cu/Ag efflux protein CusF